MDLPVFHQAPPALGNTYDADPALRAHLARALPADVMRDIEPSLREMGDIARELYDAQCADRLNEPVLTQWDAWGERVDEVAVTEAWKRAQAVAAEKGVVATAYERKHGRYSRIHQCALTYLYAPSSEFYACPLAMTDGAARTLIDLGSTELADRLLPHLTSRDPAKFWTSGQWMTELTGGSDVGRSITEARQDDAGQWRLYGRKFFTSAITTEVALTLARPDTSRAGGKGLALFLVDLRDSAGRLKNIEISRLKDKLGTRKLPTAELWLRGTPATLVAGLTDGVRNITPMLNITRTMNAITSASFMARGMTLARDYAARRVAFGAPLSDKPLHLETLAGVQAELEGAVALSFTVAALLGHKEADDMDEDQARLLRVLTPLAKLTTAKQAVATVSEIVESFGGAGYMEDTGLPLLLRDAQVLPIWEGTTNVLSLDAIGVLRKDAGVAPALMAMAERAVGAAREKTLVEAGAKAMGALRAAFEWVSSTSGDPAALEAGARRMGLTLGRALQLALLVEQGQWSLDQDDGRPAAAARRFADTGVSHLGPTPQDDARLLALGT